MAKETGKVKTMKAPKGKGKNLLCVEGQKTTGPAIKNTFPAGDQTAVKGGK